MDKMRPTEKRHTEKTHSGEEKAKPKIGIPGRLFYFSGLFLLPYSRQFRLRIY